MALLEAIIGALIPSIIGGAVSTGQYIDSANRQAREAQRAREQAEEMHREQLQQQKDEQAAREKEMRKKTMQLMERSTPMSFDPGPGAVMQASVDPIGLVASASLPKDNPFIQDV